MISAFILLGLGAGSLIFLLLFLAALIRESKARRSRARQNPNQGLALVIMERYRRDNRNKRAA